MPTPLEILLEPVSLYILGIYFSLIIWEALFPARKLPRIRHWRLKGMISFFFFFYLSTYLPILYEGWLPSSQIFDLAQLNIAVAAFLGTILYELGVFFWHLAMHRHDGLWRIFHQMHHSAERLDTYGAFYFSPFDMAGFILLGTFCFSYIMGLPPQSVTVVLLVTNFFSIFQHANIKTPVWLGYIIQRPESHAVHHAKGLHAYNYSDLPLFDLLFGTFKNPKRYVKETGFYTGASRRITDMLRFKDVSAPEMNYQTTKTKKYAKHSTDV